MLCYQVSPKGCNFYSHKNEQWISFDWLYQNIVLTHPVCYLCCVLLTILFDVNNIILTTSLLESPKSTRHRFEALVNTTMKISLVDKFLGHI